MCRIDTGLLLEEADSGSKAVSYCGCGVKRANGTVDITVDVINKIVRDTPPM